MLWSRTLNIQPCPGQAQNKDCPRNAPSAKAGEAGTPTKGQTLAGGVPEAEQGEGAAEGVRCAERVPGVCCSETCAGSQA